MTFLLLSALKGSLVLLTAVLVNIMLRRRSAALRHIVLAAALFSAAAVPVLTLVAPTWNVIIVSHWIHDLWLTEAPKAMANIPAPVALPTAKVESASRPIESPRAGPVAQIVGVVTNPVQLQSDRPAAAGKPVESAALPAAPAVPDWSWLSLLPRPDRLFAAVWLAGVALALAGLGLGLAQLVWIARKSAPAPDGIWTKVAAESAAHYRLRRPVRLLQSRDPSVLATWGVLRPTLLLPAGAEKWLEPRVRAAVYHELAHVQRADWLVQILAELARAVYWFNPLFWMVCNRLVQESEQACDDAALSWGTRESDYAAELLALTRVLNVSRRTWPAALSMARPSTLERRFKAMLDPRLNRRPASRLSSAVTAATFLLIAIPVVALQPALLPASVASIVKAVASAEHITTRVGVPLETSLTSPSAQSPTIEFGAVTTSVQGMVVELGTNLPISGVEVELTRVEGTAEVPLAIPAGTTRFSEILPHARTGDDGKFIFRDLKPGRYTLVAAREEGGYNPAEYGQRDPRGPGLAFPVLPGQTMRDIKLEMARTGAIAGRIVDEQGDPMSHVSVMVLEPRYKDGRRALSVVGTVQSGPRGEYRLFWLPPGRYYVAAKIEDLQRKAIPISINQPGTVDLIERVSTPVVQRRFLSTGETVEETYGLVYFGGVLDPEKAQAIDLQPGATASAVDIAMGMGRMRARHIRGLVTDAGGKPANDILVIAIPRQYSPDVFTLSERTDSTGAFDLAGVISGKYLLWAHPNAGNITVIPEVEIRDRDLNDQRIVLAPVASTGLPGRVVFEGAATAANRLDMAKIRLRFVPDLRGGLTAGAVTVTPKQDGTFTVSVGARRMMRVTVEGLPDDAYVKAIRVGAVDILSAGSIVPPGAEQEPMEIVIAGDTGVVSGAAVDREAHPAPNVNVVLIPAPSLRSTRPDLYKATTTDANAGFQFRGVPAGDYKLFAWEFAPENIWQDAAFLRDYEQGGKSVHVDAGGKKSIQIGAAPARR